LLPQEEAVSSTETSEATCHTKSRVIIYNTTPVSTAMINSNVVTTSQVCKKPVF